MTPAAALLLALAAQAPTFQSSVQVVYIDAFVGRGGRAVRDLTAADFEVWDEGVRQPITLVPLDDVPLMAVMVFDVSGSVDATKMEGLRSAGRALLTGLRDQDESSLVAFSHEVRVVSPRGAGRSAVAAALEDLHGSGGTALWDALYAGLELPRSRGRVMVVLFTDGADNASWLTADQVRRVASESDALLHVVTIGREPGAALEDLTALAGDTGGRVWSAEGSHTLDRAFLKILDEMRTRYLLSYEPGPEAREGWHRLTVKVKGGKGAIRSRRGYFVSR
jgi:VWFA-related protein